MSRAGLAALEKRLDALAKVVPYHAVPLAHVSVLNLCGVPIGTDAPGCEEACEAMVSHIEAVHNADTCPAGCTCDTLAGRKRCERFLPWLCIELYCNGAGHLTAWSKLGTFESDYVVAGGHRHTGVHPNGLI